MSHFTRAENYAPYIHGLLTSLEDGVAQVTVGLPNGDLGFDIIVGDLPGLLLDRPVKLACWDIGGEEPKTYGFSGMPALRLAKEIYSRSDGVGPAMAHRVVNTLGTGQTLRYLSANDAPGLSKAVKGLGGKRAETIVRSMAPHLAKYASLGLDNTGTRGIMIAEAVRALAHLGFTDAGIPMALGKHMDAMAAASETLTISNLVGTYLAARAKER